MLTQPRGHTVLYVNMTAVDLVLVVLVVAAVVAHMQYCGAFGECGDQVVDEGDGGVLFVFVV